MSTYSNDNSAVKSVLPLQALRIKRIKRKKSVWRHFFKDKPNKNQVQDKYFFAFVFVGLFVCLFVSFLAYL